MTNLKFIELDGCFVGFIGDEINKKVEEKDVGLRVGDVLVAKEAQKYGYALVISDEDCYLLYSDFAFGKEQAIAIIPYENVDQQFLSTVSIKGGEVKISAFDDQYVPVFNFKHLTLENKQKAIEKTIKQSHYDIFNLRENTECKHLDSTQLAAMSVVEFYDSKNMFFDKNGVMYWAEETKKINGQRFAKICG